MSGDREALRWPRPNDFAKMSPAEFEAYIHRTGFDARITAALAEPIQDREALRAALTLHYVTAIECDHEAKTDTVRCNCSVWTGTPQPSVGMAVQQWVDHVLAELRLVEAEAAADAPYVGGHPEMPLHPFESSGTGTCLACERLATVRNGAAIDVEGLKQAMLAAGPIGGVHSIDFQQAFAVTHRSQQQLAMEFAEAVAAAYTGPMPHALAATEATEPPSPEVRYWAENDRWSFKEGTLRERLVWCRWQHQIEAERNAQGIVAPPKTAEASAAFHRDCVKWYDGMIRDLDAATPDAQRQDRNHYDWFMPANPTAHVDGLLDEFEAKMREALTDPFVHDMSQTVLPLIAAYRSARAALATTEAAVNSWVGPDTTRLRRVPDDPAVVPTFVLDPDGPYVLGYSPKAQS